MKAAGRIIDLTATEYELLRVLTLNAGKVVTYDRMLRQVWNRHEGADSGLVRMFVSNLRRKLGDCAATPVRIVNQRAVGYCLAMPADS